MSIHYYNHLKTSVTGSVVSLKTTRLSVLWKKKGSSTLLYNRSNKKVSFLLLHKHYINFRMMTVLVKLISFCYNINIIWRTDYIFNQDADRAEDWRILNRTWIWTTCTLVFIYQQVPVVCLMLHHHLVIQDIWCYNRKTGLLLELQIMLIYRTLSSVTQQHWTQHLDGGVM